jgi:glycosyltransferase involved in cell wall biosynthesis
MKILFVLPRMVAGGVERVTLSLMKAFLADGHACELALLKAYGEFLDEARSLVTVHALAPRGLGQFVPVLAELLRRTQPTHVITAFHDLAVLVWAAIRLSGCRVCWIHGVHNTHAPIVANPGLRGAWKHWAINRMAAKFVYKRANAIVAVSDGVRAEILESFHADPSRVVTIYNPVIPDGFEIMDGKARHSPGQPFVIVAMGRLARQKGFDVLIEAMAKVPMPWQLDIWGEGPDRSLLEKMIADHNMTSAIRLRGHTADPFDVLATAELFVLPSRYEGLGNVLIEALACACRVVATDCPHGPREILLDGRLGSLVPPENPDLLAEAIIRESKGGTPIEVGLRRERVEIFTITTASRRWLSLLSLLQNPRSAVGFCM